ncbi:putative uncharacterized protein [Bacteroides sp. CAG:530]|nr:putative uncharacterized protein [Bacteroides sp. CAG:530]
MKKIYSLLTILLAAVFCFSCQSNETVSDEGCLRILAETTGITSRVIEGYNPKQLAVQIVNASGVTVESTDDFSEWETAGKTFRLAPGTYTIKAASYGFDGSESGFDVPYYAGIVQAIVKAGTTTVASLTCTLANVKVSVEFDETFKTAFKSANAVVKSAVSGVASQTFVMGETTKAAYFPVGNLTSTITVVNKLDKTYSAENVVDNVKARDWVKFVYKAKETGTGGVKVDIADNGHKYTFTFDVTMEDNKSIDDLTMVMNDANSFATCAYVYGSITAKKGEGVVDPAKIFIEYKKASASEWTSVAATVNGTDAYKATLTGLTAETAYQYRMAYRDGDTNFESEAKSFTTEAATALINGNMDDWYKSGKTWYACSESYFSANGSSFWDSSNPGTTTGAGALVNKNPTQGNATTVHTAGGKSAELKSQYASAFGIGKFAAASLYTGKFKKLQGADGAVIDFGQPFTARPTQLHGYFQYTSAKINYVGKDTPASANIVKNQTDDICSIYIALTTEAKTVDNTVVSTFVNWETDPAVVAYGELPASDCVTTNGWKEFTIDLKYHNLTTKPTHIIIVCSSSKYGDYFTGGDGSIMYVDDLSLVYGEPKTK